MRILLRYLLKLLDWFLNEGNSEMNCRTRYETTDKLMLDIRMKKYCG